MSGPIKSRRKYEDKPIIDYDPLRDIEGGKVEIFLTRLGFYIRNNFKLILMYGALVLLTGGVYIFYGIYTDQKEEQSVEAYEELMENPIMNISGAEIEAAITRLEKYETNFSSRKSQLRSNLKKAELFQNAGKKQDAAETYLRIAEDLEDRNLETYFYIKAALLLEDTEQYERAYESFVSAEKKMGPENRENYAMALVLFGKGRNLVLLGRENEGKEVLKEMMAIKEVSGIEDLRILAASFLLQQKKQ
ncbi:MAG: tetratricopeptide repeat protein [Spirochaetia bacterium]|nr:tetratricopeptide repeat protein [Spirochaetia bacterium]